MLPLVRRAHGRVIFMSSALARVSSAVRGLHCATLSAVEALAQCLRLELKPRGVDTVVVAPGEHSAVSSWLNDNNLLEQARDMWQRLAQEQRQDYGEEYFEAAIRSLEKYTKPQVNQDYLLT